jgi:hypothetical protein
VNSTACSVTVGSEECTVQKMQSKIENIADNYVHFCNLFICAKTVQLAIGTRRCSFSTSKEAGALMFIVQQSSMLSVEPVKPSPSNKNNN